MWLAKDPDIALARFTSSGLIEEFQRFILDQWQRSKRNQAKRNAQTIASVLSSAIAAGASIGSASARDAAERISAGLTGSGDFDTTTFQVPLSDQEIKAALSHLDFVDGTLVHHNGDANP